MTFVEVNETEKDTVVLVNLENVAEIAPLKDGGCVLFLSQGSGVNNRLTLRVKEGYEMFKQFAMQTVSADMIKEKVAKLKG